MKLRCDLRVHIDVGADGELYLTNVFVGPDGAEWFRLPSVAVEPGGYVQITPMYLIDAPPKDLNIAIEPAVARGEVAARGGE